MYSHTYKSAYYKYMINIISSDLDEGLPITDRHIYDAFLDLCFHPKAPVSYDVGVYFHNLAYQPFCLVLILHHIKEHGMTETEKWPTLMDIIKSSWKTVDNDIQQAHFNNVYNCQDKMMFSPLYKHSNAYKHMIYKTSQRIYDEHALHVDFEKTSPTSYVSYKAFLSLVLLAYYNDDSKYYKDLPPLETLITTYYPFIAQDLKEACQLCQVDKFDFNALIENHVQKK